MNLAVGRQNPDHYCPQVGRGSVNLVVGRQNLGTFAVPTLPRNRAKATGNSVGPTSDRGDKSVARDRVVVGGIGLLGPRPWGMC